MWSTFSLVHDEIITFRNKCKCFPSTNASQTCVTILYIDCFHVCAVENAKNVDNNITNSACVSQRANRLDHNKYTTGIKKKVQNEHDIIVVIGIKYGLFDIYSRRCTFHAFLLPNFMSTIVQLCNKRRVSL